MSIAELFIIGIGLSMDAFAIAICKGLGMKKLNLKQGIVIALFFGGFQALMPVIGWLLGKQFEAYIVSIDHWVAFVLLAVIGGKMLWEAIKSGDEESSGSSGFSIKELFLLAIATSIDALAVGVTFAFLGVNITSSALIIGCTTFVISLVGVFIGHKFGSRFEKKAEIAGGVMLIFIGLKILLEHLGVISF